MPRGQGKSDFVDAVTVAADIINRALQARPELEKLNVSKEIVLISNFKERVKEEDVHEFVAALIESLKRPDVSSPCFADTIVPLCWHTFRPSGTALICMSKRKTLAQQSPSWSLHTIVPCHGPTPLSVGVQSRTIFWLSLAQKRG